MMKFKTVVLCLKLLIYLILQRSFGNVEMEIQKKFLFGSSSRKLYILYAQSIMTSVLSFFSNVFDFYCSFSKRRLVDFVTASVLTKLPIEKAIAKPQKCSIANNETLLWTFAWHFLKIFLKFKKELVFSFKASRNLRSKSYQLVGVSYVLWC